MSILDAALQDLFGVEGGYVNDPRDPGGETNWGISKRSFPNLDIRRLTRDEAAAIYRVRYWAPIQGDALPPQLAHITFDAAVNSGPKAAIRWLQLAVGAEADGLLGTATLRAVNAMVQRHGIDLVVTHALAERALFMAALPTFRTFGRGWNRRLFGLPTKAARAARNP